MHRIAVASVALVAIAATGCHPSGGHGAAAPDPAVVVARAAALHTAAGNRTATSAETQRLLALAPLPSGAKPTSRRPAATNSPAFGTPAASVVERHSYFYVEQPVDSVMAYLRAHRPATLRPSGLSTAGGPDGVTSEGIGWSEPDQSYATDLQLVMSIAASGDGSGTVIRADGMGVWLDPRPVRDTAAGPRLRVVAAGPCPRTDTRMVGVTNAGEDLRNRLLPAAQPTRALICRYAGLNSTPPFALARSMRLDRKAAGRLAAAYLQLRVAHPDRWETSCPMDDASIDVVSFGYAGRADIDLWAKANGCGAVSNGVIVVAGRVPVGGAGAMR